MQFLSKIIIIIVIVITVIIINRFELCFSKFDLFLIFNFYIFQYHVIFLLYRDYLILFGTI